jgi:GntR family transcriptional regulator
VALVQSYLSPRIPVKLKASMFDEHTSLFALLSKAGFEIGSCDETIEARIPTSDIRDILGMDNESAVFYKERVTYDTKNRPFEFLRIYYNSNFYRYYIKNGQAFRERYGENF